MLSWVTSFTVTSTHGHKLVANWFNVSCVSVEGDMYVSQHHGTRVTWQLARFSLIPRPPTLHFAFTILYTEMEERKQYSPASMYSCESELKRKKWERPGNEASPHSPR